MRKSARMLVVVAVIALVSCLALMCGCSKKGVAEAASASAAQENAACAKDADGMPDESMWSTWNEEVAPNYVYVTGSAVVIDVPEPGEIVYGELDELGRTTYAVGNITKELRDAGTANGHDDFASGDDPSGWPSPNPKVEIVTPTGKVYRGYMWNRSHLIADSLGGQAIKANAVTGTRMQNVGANNGEDAGGMAFCEVKARKWLDANPDGTLYYRADAMYAGDELVPRAVIVNMKSSDGELDMQVIVYNAAKGFEIDYR